LKMLNCTCTAESIFICGHFCQLLEPQERLGIILCLCTDVVLVPGTYKIPRTSCSGTCPINVTCAPVNVHECLVHNSESCTYQAKQCPLEQMPSRSISLWILHGLEH
jgi:hypothetical protein